MGAEEAMKPMTWEQYQASRANGWTDDDLKQQGYEIPSPPQASSPAPGQPPAQKAQAGYGRLAKLGSDMLSPSKWGEALVSAIGAMPAADETVGVLAGAQALGRGQNPIKEYDKVRSFMKDRFRKADAESGDLGAAARLGTMFLPAGAAGLGAEAIKVGTRAGPAMRAVQELGTGALTGAGYGAASGALNAEPGERLKAAGVGLGAGALLGTFLTGVPMAARGVRDYFGGNRAGTATRRVSEAANEVLKRQGVPEDRISGDLTNPAVAPNARAAANALYEQPGTFASGKRIMDTSPEMRELSKDAANASPAAERTMEQMARGRVRAQNPALAEDFAQGIGAAPNVNAERLRDLRAEQLTQTENTLYPQLFAAYPNPVKTPEAVGAWKMADDLLPKYTAAVQRNQALASQPMDEIVQMIGKTPTPTLEGMHRLKTQVGSALKALGSQEAAGNISDEGVALQRSLTIFQDRLRHALETAPNGAGQIYSGIQAMGATGRTTNDLIAAGLDLAGPKIAGYPAEQAMADATQRLPGSGPAALRAGAATRVSNTADALPFDSNTLLNQLGKEPATQQAVEALAKDPKAAAQFAKNMQDRLAMEETNAMQLGGATKQKEILKGARARGTALGYGEAGALGGVASGNPLSALRGAKLAGGALLAKALEGRRGLAVQDAGDELTQFLLRNPGERGVPLAFFDMLLANARLQQQRLTRAAQRGAVAGALGGSLTRR